MKKIPRSIIYLLIILSIILIAYFVYPKYQFKTIKYGKDTILVIKKVEPPPFPHFPTKIKFPEKSKFPTR